jgi:rRNA maturation endonuclease Nob1
MEVSLTEFVMWTVAMALGLTGLSIFTSRLSRRGAERRSLRYRVICRLCLHAWEDHGLARTVECPECGGMNERDRRRRLG